jgi:hypothetical protein
LEAWYSSLGRAADNVTDRILVDSELTSALDDDDDDNDDDDEWPTLCSTHFTPTKESLEPIAYDTEYDLTTSKYEIHVHAASQLF